MHKHCAAPSRHGGEPTARERPHPGKPLQSAASLAATVLAPAHSPLRGAACRPLPVGPRTEPRTHFPGGTPPPARARPRWALPGHRLVEHLGHHARVSRTERGQRIRPRSPKGCCPPILGTPLKSDQYKREALREQLPNHVRLLDKLPGLPDLQSVWLLFLMCAVPPSNYMLRSLPTWSSQVSTMRESGSACANCWPVRDPFNSTLWQPGGPGNLATPCPDPRRRRRIPLARSAAVRVSRAALSRRARPVWLAGHIRVVQKGLQVLPGSQVVMGCHQRRLDGDRKQARHQRDSAGLLVPRLRLGRLHARGQENHRTRTRCRPHRTGRRRG